MKENQRFAFVRDNRGVLLSPTKEEKAWYLISSGKKLVEKIPRFSQSGLTKMRRTMAQAST